MDYRSRDISWTARAESAFARDLSEGTESSHKSELKRLLKNLLQKRSRTWWNKITLEKYLSRGLIPRGLRVQVFPSFPIESETFKQQWELASSACSKVFLELLVGHNASTLTTLESEIEELSRKVKSELTTDEFNAWNYELDQWFKEWEVKIETTKVKKFQRDLQDSQLNRVYRWRQQPPALVRTASMSSVSSTGAASNASSSTSGRRRFGGPRRRIDYRQRHGEKRHTRQPFNASHPDQPPKVINLSTISLTPIQEEVLELGLSFCPESHFNLFSTVKDINLFARKLVLKKLHSSGYEERDTLSASDEANILILQSLLDEQEPSPSGRYPAHLLPRSMNFPSLSIFPEIDTFVKTVTKALREVPETRAMDNLSYKQRVALKALQNMDEVVIKPSDKGGNVVLWPTTMYEREMFRQLRNAECYQRLTFNPLTSFRTQLSHILDNGKENGIITQRQLEGLMYQHPMIATIYLLPKVHKNLIPPPGRPIVSGSNSLTEPICRYVDHFLKPMVELLPSYIKDTNDVLKRLEGVQLDNDMRLVTCDVESLYTSIRHTDGIAATKFFLESSDLNPDLCSFILELLTFALTKNFFMFRGVLYLQRQGTAMGAACAPSYANLFLGLWERTLFTSGTLPFADQVISWGRYIDDVLFIWQGSSTELDQFMDHLNNNNLNIHLTYKSSQTNIEFLDIQITVDPDGFVQTDLFRKATAANTLLHARSAHPYHLAQDLKQRFQERGHSNRSINRAYQRAKRTSRSSLLHHHKEPDSTPNQVRCILDFNSRSSEVVNILNQHWPILLSDHVLSKCLKPRPAISYRRAPNLKDSLVHSHYDTKGFLRQL